MKFNLRRIGDYASCELEEGSAGIQFGMMNREEALRLLEDFRAAVDDLEWFVHVTDKEPA
jgi:hypothetical protein